MQPNLEGARKPPARQHQHQQMGLHFDQHEGVPQQAILACEVIAQEQKCSDTEVRQVSPCAVQESGESPSGSGKQKPVTLGGAKRPFPKAQLPGWFNQSTVHYSTSSGKGLPSGRYNP